MLQVQVGYSDLGEVPATARATVPAGKADAYARALLDSLPISASGYEASVGFRYPFNDAVAVAARVGAWRWENEQRATFGAQRLKATLEATDALLTLGFEWTFTPRWSVGIEASRYRTDEGDIDLLAGSVKFLW